MSPRRARRWRARYERFYAGKPAIQHCRTGRGIRRHRVDHANDADRDAANAGNFVLESYHSGVGCLRRGPGRSDPSLGLLASKKLVTPHRIDRTTPPSTRRAAPYVAEDSGLHTKATSAATSSVLAKRFNSDEGRILRKNSFSTSVGVVFCSLASSPTNLPTPSDAVGPGSTELTVTFVPAVVSARPRAIASCAVLVIP